MTTMFQSIRSGKLQFRLRFVAPKMGSKSRARFAITSEGYALMEPVKDAMAFFGVGTNDVPYDEAERKKAREEMERNAANE